MSATMDETRERAAIKPLRFWVEYRDTANGEMAGDDWVEWVKKGDMHAATTAEKVARVKRDPILWGALEPFYAAWKKNEDAPIDGMPLAAVPFMSRELVDALARVHIRSLEDFIGAGDADLARMNVPGVRAMQAKARAFKDAQATAGIAAELAALRAQVETLTAEKAEAERTVETLAAETGRRRRTRDEVMAGA